MASFRIHQTGELRLGEAQQRANRFGFDVEHPRHRVRFDPFVTEPQGNRVGVREGVECLGAIHASTVRMEAPERLGSALRIFSTTKRDGHCTDGYREVGSRLWAGLFRPHGPVSWDVGRWSAGLTSSP